MFVRTKEFQNKDGTKRTYLQIVKNVWENGKSHQKVVCTLGRLKDLRKGPVDSLLKSLSRFSERLEVIEIRKDISTKEDKEYGAPLVFRKLFKLVGLDKILDIYLVSHSHTFNVKEAIFAMILNRILSPASKLRVYEWLDEVYDPHFDGLELHHLYRALDFLDEHKEKIEDSLFDNVKDLFNLKLDVVFYDTTSIYFEGKGPENLAKKGFSKDNHPEDNQVVIGILTTGEGFPIACEIFPGSMYDAKTLREALTILSGRFKIKRLIFVADRGMVSEDNLSLIKREGYEYIVGVRMRKLKKIKNTVLSTPGRYKDVEDNLKVKEIRLDKERYIICYNPYEAEKDRKDRDKIIKNLQEKIKTGSLSKVLTGDAKRFCKIETRKIILNKEKIQREARYDGKYVLQTNTTLSSDKLARAYKNLWMIERAFRDIKNIFKIRPIFHWTPSRVRGHIFICFLAFLLTVFLQRRLSEIGVKENVWKVIRDVSRVKAIKLYVRGKAYLARTELQGLAYKAFRAAGVQIPPPVQELS